jgi:hypothetical protein
MAAKSGGGGDSKQGLIITLVLFVLLSVILGVTTYLGFSGQTALEAKTKEAEKLKSDYDQDGDWYKFQAYTFRTYLGQPLSAKEKDSYDVLRGKFDQSATGMNTRDPEKETVTKLIKETLDKSYRWDPAAKKVAETTADQITALKKALETSGKTSDELKTALKAEQDKSAALNKSLSAEQVKNKEALENLRKEMNAELTKWRDQAQDLQNRLTVQGETIAKITTDMDNAAKANAKLVARKDKTISDLTAKLNRKDQEEETRKLETMQANAKFTRLDNDKPRGEIMFVNGSGQTPFINLGSADNVKPGLRFTVHGIDANGKANLEAKATLEVIEVIKPHMSQGRLVAIVNPSGDPVIVGDKLFNPVWDPERKTHVAISGLVDLSGEKHDRIQEFMQELKKHGVEVDAYLDLREGDIKGEITRKTDFLILGDYVEDSNLRITRDKDRLAAVNKKMKEMQDTAIRNGVRPIKLNDFLTVTGHAPAAADTPNYNFRSSGAAPQRKGP